MGPGALTRVFRMPVVLSDAQNEDMTRRGA
jgi:hypothetical protein